MRKLLLLLFIASDCFGQGIVVQNRDQYLDFGGANQISAAQAKSSYTSSQIGHVLTAGDTMSGILHIKINTPLKAAWFDGFGIASDPSTLQIRKARGTANSPDTVHNGDQISEISFSGYNGSIYYKGASINSVMSNPLFSGAIPTSLLFKTSDQSSGLLERMRITQEGRIGIGTSSPTEKFHVSQDIDDALVSIIENLNIGNNAVAQFSASAAGNELNLGATGINFNALPGFGNSTFIQASNPLWLINGNSFRFVIGSPDIANEKMRIDNSGLNINSSENIVGNLSFTKNIDHIITVLPSTNDGGIGGNLSIIAGNGKGASGGILYLSGGGVDPNSSSTGDVRILSQGTQNANTGSINLTTGDVDVSSGNSGDININVGLVDAGTKGNINIGNGGSNSVNIGLASNSTNIHGNISADNLSIGGNQWTGDGKFLAAPNTVTLDLTNTLEQIVWNWGSSQVYTDDGTIVPLERFHIFSPPTSMSGAGSHIRKAATLAISNAPQTDELLIDTGYSIWSQAGKAEFDGGIGLNPSINTTAGDAATINKSAGRFRKDNTGSTFTLTNSFITANSIIICQMATIGLSTGFDMAVIASSGSAVITFETSGIAAAPSASADVNFIVLN